MVVGITISLSAQPLCRTFPDAILYETFDNISPCNIFENNGAIWVVNERGNLITLRNSNEYELAKYLNTSPRIVQRLLKQQGYKKELNDTIFLHKGDSLIIDYGFNLVSDTLLGIGKFICRQMDNNLDKYFFSNYWNGCGDIELSTRQFVGILLYLKQHLNIPIQVVGTLTEDSVISLCLVSFYNTPYEQSFGSATLCVDSNNQIVGIFDFYNFDAKKWGIRPVYYEFFVRLVSRFSPSNAAGFNVYYGKPHRPSIK